MNWHVGQRVVCIRDDYKVICPTQIAGGGVLRAGHVYTIRGFNLAEGVVGTGCGFYLEEIVNPLCQYSDGVWREMSFDQCGFRPIKETDISIFTAMLNEVPTKETV